MFRWLQGRMDGWIDGRVLVLYFRTNEGLIGQPGTMTMR